MSNITGGCLCGAVRFAYDGELGGEAGALTLCLCAMCRRAGSYAAAVAPAHAAGFRLTAGEGVLREYESSPGKLRAFCGQCGTPIYSRRTSEPGALRLRLGAFDELPQTLRIEAVIHTAAAPPWTRIEGAAVFSGVEAGRPSGSASETRPAK